MNRLTAKLLQSDNQTSGGRGWFGAAGGGFDYQFAGLWVASLFADFDFSDIHGHPSDPYWDVSGPIKQKWAWFAGARAGYLLTPDVLAYLSGGFTQSSFSDVQLLNTGIASQPLPDMLPAATYNGWFVGGAPKR